MIAPQRGADLLHALRASTDEMIAATRALIEVESPTGDAAGVEAAARVVQRLSADLDGPPGELVVPDGVPHLVLGSVSGARVVLIGHLDTVWPLGSLDRTPFSVEGDLLRGPGCFDMKAGVVQGLYAWREAGFPDDVCFVLSGDEEVGSRSAEVVIRRALHGAQAALVLEPSASGALKTERKGISTYRVDVTGRAAHSGLEPEAGINALLEAGTLAATASALANPSVGTTVTPTRGAAGSALNTVPATAWVDFDVRACTADEQERVDIAMQQLRPIHPEARLEVSGGINRPPLDRRASADLYLRAVRVAEDLGLPSLEQASVGGGSDGNIAAAMGIPTLDGLGAVGDGAHADYEHVRVSTIAERAALVAGLIGSLRRS